MIREVKFSEFFIEKLYLIKKSFLNLHCKSKRCISQTLFRQSGVREMGTGIQNPIVYYYYIYHTFITHKDLSNEKNYFTRTSFAR